MESMNPHDDSNPPSSITGQSQPLLHVASQDYEYERLKHRDSIRLLHILPGQASDPLTCTMVHERLENNPEYNAMSYAWGSPEKPKFLHLRPQGRPMPVTQNCFRMLKQIRDNSLTIRPVWVDAVCINQGRNEEKNHQLKLMGEIYKQARQVLVYPGKFLQESKDVLLELQQLEEKSNNGVYRIANNMRSMLLQGWFSRTWVLQEVILAQHTEVILGQTTVPWDRFADTAKTLQGDMREYKRREDLFLPIELPEIFSVVNLTRANAKTHSLPLCDLLYMTRNLNVTDPRDKIYALLGLVGNPEHLPAVEYGNSPESVHVAFARRLIVRDRTLDILSVYTKLFKPEMWDAPFWLPWRGNGARGNLLPIHEPPPIVCVAMKAPFYAHGGLKAFVQDEEPNVLPLSRHALTARGRMLGRVDVVPGPITLNTTRQSLHRRLLWALEQASKCSKYPGEPEGDIVFRVLTFNHSPDVSNAKEIEEKADEGLLCEEEAFSAKSLAFWMEVYHERLQTTAPIFECSNTYRGNGDYAPNVSGRAFIKTDKGYFGLAPNWSEEGDLVCCLAGGRVPFALREERICEDGIEKVYYKMVGECYIHGVMEGQVMSGKGMDDLDTFVLI